MFHKPLDGISPNLQFVCRWGQRWNCRFWGQEVKCQGRNQPNVVKNPLLAPFCHCRTQVMFVSSEWDMFWVLVEFWTKVKDQGHRMTKHCLRRWKAYSLMAPYWLGMWRSSHSNSTTFELPTFSADSKFVEFFMYPLSNSNLRSTRSAPHVYTHRPPEQMRCLIVWKYRK